MNDLLSRIVAAYEALQATEGATAFLDSQQTFTAGVWVGSRLGGLIEEARDELYAAVTRYRNALIAIPVEWLEELVVLERQIQARGKA